MELWKYLVVGFMVPIFWGIVFWLTRRFAPGLMAPVGVAYREWRLRRQRTTK